jgi:predicted amidophosphoribosyltransferase
MKRLATGLGDLVCPRLCAACGTPISGKGGALCLECWLALGRSIGGAYCRRCGDDRGEYLLADGLCTNCQLKRPGPRFDGFIRVGRYTGPLRSLLLQFKRRFVLDRLLGDLLGSAILGRIDPASVDLWVPVPSHWRRRLMLGHQPTLSLCRAAVRRWRGRVEPVLRARRYVRPFHLQKGLSRAGRTAAIRGAFGLSPRCSLKGLTVCVVDDVTTTGATLFEARRALLDGKAARVMAAVVAKVSRNPPILEGQGTGPREQTLWRYVS